MFLWIIVDIIRNTVNLYKCCFVFFIIIIIIIIIIVYSPSHSTPELIHNFIVNGTALNNKKREKNVYTF